MSSENTYFIGVSIDSLHTISVGAQTPILLAYMSSLFPYILDVSEILAGMLMLSTTSETSLLCSLAHGISLLVLQKVLLII